MTEKKSFFKRKKKPIIITAVLAFLAAIIIVNITSQREKSIKVYIEKTKTHDLVSIISASGEVKPKKNVNLSAHIMGRIVKIGVKEGQLVKAGDFLLKLEATQYEANADRDRAFIRTNKADLIRAQAVLNRDKNLYLRQKKLFDELLTSREEMEAAKAQHDISKAQHEATTFQIKQAEASLRSTLDILEKTTFYSPIDGIITSLRVEEGEIALMGTMNNPGTILMSIADLSIMEVEIEVDETDVIGVELGQPAEVKVDAFPERLINGKVTEIGSSALQNTTASEESKDFKVVITLEDPPVNLKPGLSASADIITAKKMDVIAVPISSLALKEEKGGNDDTSQEEGVYVIIDNRAVFTPVIKGIMGELMIEITSGLEEGQTVITGPYSALRLIKDNTLVQAEEKKEGV